MKKNFLIYFSLFFFITTDITPSSIQLTQEILKNISPEATTENETLLITACKLINNAQLSFCTPDSSIWQSIVYNKIIADVLKNIKRTQTHFGYIALAKQCTSASTDLQIVEQKTSLLKYLESNQNLTQKLQTIIKNSVDSEKQFLKACQNLNEFEKLYFKNYGLDKFNANKHIHNVWTRSNLLLPTSMIIFQLLMEKFQIESFLDPLKTNQTFLTFIQATIPEKIKSIAQGACTSLAEYPSIIASLPKNLYNHTVYDHFKNNFAKTTKMSPEQIESFAKLLTGMIYTVGIISTGQIGYNIYQAYKNNKETFDNIHKQQKILIATSKLLQTIQQVCDEVEQNPSLLTLLPEYHELKELFNPESQKTSKDLKKLIKELLSPSFKTSTSYYFSETGKIIATYHNFIKLHAELIPYFVQLGMIDMYLSIFTLYQEYKDNNHTPICLATFKNFKTPQISVTDLWHPLLDPSSAVTNNLTMGYNNNNKNLIITGPNAGGKTTFLTALVINIILAQSFGIAYAKNFIITPFSKIHSYLDITTNIKEGESLFKAELNRAKALKESILSCNNSEKTFTIIDEIFSGTNQEVASDIGFDFAKILGSMQHSMTIITTHIPKLTTLNEHSNFYNYKVADAHIALDGTISYPFKLIPGISTQNIAREMLKFEGVL